MTANNPNPYKSPASEIGRVEHRRKSRTKTSRAASFVVYAAVSFILIYITGIGYYQGKLYDERPPGANYATLGKMAGEEFRAKHPFLLFLAPLITGGARAALPR